MNHLQVRCPACEKLYEVNPAQIHSLCPHFECVVCRTLFCFDFPPVHPQNIATRKLLKDSPPAVVVKKETGKVCPSCGSLNNHSQQKCYSCQSSFEFNEYTVTHQPAKTDAGILQLWNRIFTDYENEELHQDFIKKCQSLDALAFASKKYQELKDAQGGDPLCHKMILQIQMLVDRNLAENREFDSEPSMPPTWGGFIAWLRTRNWKRVLYWTPLVVSSLMILLGTSRLGFRNLIGLGFATALLSYGLLIMIKGKIKVSDFID